MHASSSIFLVIIALWAAFLVPGTIKRRRRSASARIADRDSSALRVVVRRVASPTGSPATPAASTPAASTPAASTPAATLEPSSRGVLGRSAAAALPAATVPVPGAGSTPAAVPTGAAVHGGAAVVRRRRRLVLLLLAVSAVCGAAGALGALPVLLAGLPSLGLVLVLAVLARHGATRHGATRHGATRPSSAPVVVTRSAPARQAAPVVGREPARDVTAVLPAQRETVPVVAAEGSWEPVAVPLPTYLLKPKAPERPEPAPAPAAQAPADETPTVLIDLRERVRAVSE